MCPRSISDVCHAPDIVERSCNTSSRQTCHCISHARRATACSVVSALRKTIYGFVDRCHACEVRWSRRRSVRLRRQWWGSTDCAPGVALPAYCHDCRCSRPSGEDLPAHDRAAASASAALGAGQLPRVLSRNPR